MGISSTCFLDLGVEKARRHGARPFPVRSFLNGRFGKTRMSREARERTLITEVSAAQAGIALGPELANVST